MNVIRKSNLVQRRSIAGLSCLVALAVFAAVSVHNVLFHEIWQGGYFRVPS